MKIIKQAQILVAVLSIFCSPVWAKIVEEQFSLDVQVRNAWGKDYAGPIVVTTFVDDQTPSPRPIIVIGHGRPVLPQERAATGRARFSQTSRWFAERGFIVAVPTRVGYGVSGGEDVEDSGPCNRKNYPPAYEAAAVQTVAVIEAIKKRPDANPSKVVVMGQSFGGTTAIAVSAKPVDGLIAAINFAGGGGGNPIERPGDPCSTYGLRSLFAGYGKAARIPTLWAYSENDLWMGAKYPRE
jgi:dienelactone hydrolase